MLLVIYWGNDFNGNLVKLAGSFSSRLSLMFYHDKAFDEVKGPISFHLPILQQRPLA